MTDILITTRKPAAVNAASIRSTTMADAAAPTLIRENDKAGALYVLMPMRV